MPTVTITLPSAVALLLIREVAVAIIYVIVRLPSDMALTYLKSSRQGPRKEKEIIAGSPEGKGNHSGVPGGKRQS